MVHLLFRASVVLGFLGMVLGLYMGISQDFTLMPAHAHLNLIGFVALFLVALYYRTTPRAANLLIAKIQAAAALTGAVLFPVGIACVRLGGHERFKPVVATGAIIVLLGMALFVLVVFRTSGSRSRATASTASAVAPAER